MGIIDKCQNPQEFYFGTLSKDSGEPPDSHSIFEVGGVTYDDREGYFHLSIGLAWHIDVLPEGYTFYWHGGRTNGYMAYIAFDLENLSGAEILCNQSYAGVITRFGEDVLKAVNKCFSRYAVNNKIISCLIKIFHISLI